MKRKPNNFFLLVTLCAALLNAGAAPAPSQAVIDGRLWPSLDGAGTAPALVLLKARPNLAGAALNTLNGDRRAEAVVNGLRNAAEQSQARVLAALRAAGAKNIRAYWVANAVRADIDAPTARALADLPEVERIEPDAAFRVDLEQPELNAPQSPMQAAGIEPGISFMGGPDLWALGYTGQGIVVAGSDTGIQWDHPALKSHYRGWDGASANHNYNWWDAIHATIGGGMNPCGYSSQAPCDDYGHGTHTVGTMVGDDGQGNQIGMAPGAKWIGCRNMDNGIGRPSTYIECLQFFIAPTDLAGQNPNPLLRPDIIDNSYGCPPSEQCSALSLLEAVQNVRAAGIFMAVSAGNGGSNCSTIVDPPSIYAEVFTLGNVYVNGGPATSSSRGPVTVDGSGRIKPDAAAPGMDVRSAYPPNLYSKMSGTSMAAPHAAGAVALLWSARPELKRHVDVTEWLLRLSAAPQISAQGCGGLAENAVPNNVTGYGVINALRAYQAAYERKVYLGGVLNGQ